MDSTAIKTIADLAITAARANQLDTDTPAVIIDGKVISIEHLQAERSRFRGNFVTNSIAAFVAFVLGRHNEESNPSIFIDADVGSARCFFNLGSRTAPGHADDLATIKLTPTAAYSALIQIDGKRLLQKDLAEFIEEWSQHISAFLSSGDEMSLAAAAAAIRNIKIKRTAESNSAVGDFAARRSVLDEIEARSNGEASLPGFLLFRVVPYAGLAEQIAELRLSIITSEADKPQLAVRWARREQVREAIGQDFERVLRDELSNSNAVINIGTFTP